MYFNKCETYCPFSYFLIKENKSCKKCNDTSCDAEIPRTQFTVTKKSSLKFSAVVEKKIYFKKLTIGSFAKNAKDNFKKIRKQEESMGNDNVTADFPRGERLLLNSNIAHSYNTFSINQTNIDSGSERILQETPSKTDEYCLAEIKTLKEEQDYTVKVTSSLVDNILTCNAEFDLFRSFRNKHVEFKLNPNLYSGNNVIIDENQNPVYLSEGIYNITEFQRYSMISQFNTHIQQNYSHYLLTIYPSKDHNSH